jgi:hypothetical protein
MRIFVILLERRTLDVQEEDGYNNSFSFRAGQDSIPELAEKEVSEEESVNRISEEV